MVMPRETLEGSEFFNDWSRPQGYLSVMGATLLVEDGWRVEFVVPGKREFGAEQLKLYNALSPHLTRARATQSAARAHRHGARGRRRRRSTDLPEALLVVDASSRVLFANRAANALFGNGAGACMTACCGSASTARPRSRAGSSAPAPRASRRAPAVTSRSRAACIVRRCRLLVMPTRGQPPWLMAYRPCAMIFIADPETSAAPDAVYLQRQFKLTPAEAALTQELLQGDGIAAAADRIGIAVATARGGAIAQRARQDRHRPAGSSWCGWCSIRSTVCARTGEGLNLA